ncbi:MAG: DUF1828 domain-containing protein [Acidimicrobiaceae bacterium]|nr:DUF1828 domain-containing protein [Acidimicrobiaceae bacterium]
MQPDELCESLRACLSKLFECTLLPQGSVRVRTPFMYPDGDIVDLFVDERDGKHLVTDYGESLGWLQMQSPRDQLTSNQLRMIDDVCLTLGVELKRGQLTLQCTDASELGDVVHRLGQAAVRVSDIWFTLRTRAVTSVADEVDQWLRERKFESARNERLKGRSGRSWTVDYEVIARSQTSHVFLLTTGSQAWARRLCERVVAACIDLSHLTFKNTDASFVSLFDDTSNVWRDEDFTLVEQFSRIAIWSQPEEFEQILTTASTSS